MVRPQVHSVKHYVQQSLRTITASTVESTVVVQAQNVSDVDLVNEVTEGNTIKAVYFELWLRTQSTSPGSFVVIIEKIISGGGNATATNMAALGDYANKKNILFTSQALINDQDADAIPVLRQWIAIPKTKQRFGLKDKLVLQVFAQGALDMTACGFETYKEYS